MLRGLGFTSAQLRARAFGRGVDDRRRAAAVVATVTAALLSALTPVGVARQAELHPGIAVNVAYLGAGLARACSSSWWSLERHPALLVTRVRSARGATRHDARHRGSRVGGALASAGASTAAEAGVRMALEPGRGRTSVPVRSTIISAILGVAVITGVLGFSASLRHLLHEPRLYGWNWDIQVGDQFAPDLRPEADALARSPGDRSGRGRDDRATAQRFGALRHARDRPGEGIDRADGRRRAGAEVGRPRSWSGTRTLEDLHRHVGDDDRRVGRRTDRSRLRVVGRGVLPEFAGTARLGEGAAMTYDGARRSSATKPSPT